jgi:hypothetical protein
MNDMDFDFEPFYVLDEEDEVCEPTTEEIEEDILDPCGSCPGCY